MRVGLLGAGTVGSSLLDVLVRHGSTLTDRLGEPLEVAAVVVRDAARPRRLSLPEGAVVTTDAGRVVDDPTVDIVVEAMGGVEPALAYALRALGRGAALVTANKALVAEGASALMRAARQGGGDLLFEAAVGAAVPVVGTLDTALSAARVRAVAGVLNGSTNYLLAMMAEGVPLDDAVLRARAQGYLEADPSEDVDGHDSARKIAIVASLAGGVHVPPAAVHCRGLEGVGPGDLVLAAELGCALKLLAVAERADVDAPFAVWVAPALVAGDQPLAAPYGAANAVAIAAEPGGETVIAGQGAGGPATAQAVAGDVLLAARRRRAGLRGPMTAWREASGTAPEAMPAYPYVLRATSREGAEARLEAALAKDAEVARTWPSASGAIGVESVPLAPAAVAALRARLAHRPEVAAVGAPLVRWPGLGARDGETWWRVPRAPAGRVTAPAAGALEGRPT